MLNFDREVSFSQAQESLSRLYQTVGIDMLPSDYQQLSFNELVSVIEKMLIEQGSGAFNKAVDTKYASIEPEVKAVRQIIEMQELAKIDKQLLLVTSQISEYAKNQDKILTAIESLHFEEKNALSAEYARKFKVLEREIELEKLNLSKLNDKIIEDILQTESLHNELIQHHKSKKQVMNARHEREFSRYKLSLEDDKLYSKTKYAKIKENRYKEYNGLKREYNQDFDKQKIRIIEDKTSSIESINSSYNKRGKSLLADHRYKLDTISDDYNKLNIALVNEYKSRKIDEGQYNTKKIGYMNQESSDLKSENDSFVEKKSSLEKQRTRAINEQEIKYKKLQKELEKSYQEKVASLSEIKAQLTKLDQNDQYYLSNMNEIHANKLENLKNIHSNEKSELVKSSDKELALIDMKYKSIRLKLGALEAKKLELDKNHKKLQNELKEEIDNRRVLSKENYNQKVASHQKNIDKQNKLHETVLDNLKNEKEKVRKEYGN